MLSRRPGIQLDPASRVQLKMGGRYVGGRMRRGELEWARRVKLRGRGGKGEYALWSSIFPEVAGVVSIEKPSRIEHRPRPLPPPAILSPGCASARCAAEAKAMHPHHPPAIGRRVAANARSVVKLRIPPPPREL